ncbi:tRNase Z [Saccharomycopsis crataegensis]|uniref:ribonuclease Z n=1 Tax=Saccharomycopsis crataegensis TaxID=43959 RepID=A0AAV5QH44_9ASCO|nr:tRNase Z [Saccharomycopsis crataegensis]
MYNLWSSEIRKSINSKPLLAFSPFKRFSSRRVRLSKKEVDSGLTRVRGPTHKALRKPISKSVPMFEVRTCGHPTADTTDPLLTIVSSGGDSYLFGSVFEGAQRSCTEQGIKLHRIKNIFLTGELNWPRTGGLPGSILSISDRGKTELDLSYGNELLSHLVATWRYFVFRKGITLSCHSVGFNESFYKDEVVTVRGFQVPISSRADIETSTPDLESKSKYISFLNRIVGHMFPLSVPANRPNTQVSMSPEELLKITESDPNLNDGYVNTRLPRPMDIINDFKGFATNYLVEFEPVRGKFDIKKAIELNIPKGKLYAQLSNGKPVTLEDGRVIQPEEVVSSPRTYNKLMILDIKSQENLENTLQIVGKLIEENQNKFQNLSLVYYFMSGTVTLENNQPLKELITLLTERLGVEHHVVSHKDYVPNSLVFKSSGSLTLKLKSLFNNSYRLPIFSFQPQKKLESVLKVENAKIYPLLTGQSFTMDKEDSTTHNDNPQNHESTDEYWKSEFQSGIGMLNVQSDKIVPISQTLNSSGTDSVIIPTSTIVPSTISSEMELIGYLESTTQVIALGTGSAIPSGHRNVSSTMLRIPFEQNGQIKYRSVLLDGGENTLGTIKRIFSPSELHTFFTEELQCIYLSHLHADHHLGIVSVIEEWIKYKGENNEDKLYIIAPWQYQRFLYDVQVIDNGLKMQRIVFINCEEFMLGKSIIDVPQKDTFNDDAAGIDKPVKIVEDSKEETLKNNQGNNELNANDRKYKRTCRQNSMIYNFYDALSINKVLITRAHHCQWSYSVTFDFKLTNSVDNTSFKVSYSGDTRPVHRFADMGKDSHILIHEATLEDSLQSMAIAKCHSTISEAIGVGKEMRAKKTILTHFSQRYAKVPPQVAGIEGIEFAFDGAIWKYGDMGMHGAELLPVFNEMCDEQKEIDEINGKSQREESLVKREEKKTRKKKAD